MVFLRGDFARLADTIPIKPTETNTVTEREASLLCSLTWCQDSEKGEDWVVEPDTRALLLRGARHLYRVLHNLRNGYDVDGNPIPPPLVPVQEEQLEAPEPPDEVKLY